MGLKSVVQEICCLRWPTPTNFLKKEGYEIDVYSVKGGEAPIEMVEPEDSVNQAFLKGDGPGKFKNSGRIEEVTTDKYDAVFVPGGLAPVADLPDNPTVLLSEGYRSAAAQQAHVNSDHYKKLATGGIVPLLNEREVFYTIIKNKKS